MCSFGITFFITIAVSLHVHSPKSRGSTMWTLECETLAANVTKSLFTWGWKVWTSWKPSLSWMTPQPHQNPNQTDMTRMTRLGGWIGAWSLGNVAHPCRSCCTASLCDDTTARRDLNVACDKVNHYVDSLPWNRPRYSNIGINLITFEMMSSCNQPIINALMRGDCRVTQRNLIVHVDGERWTFKGPKKTMSLSRCKSNLSEDKLTPRLTIIEHSHRIVYASSWAQWNSQPSLLIWAGQLVS